ncbi:type II secretory pathway predicted ATPase ExeA [Peribacillus cavernae]|nr:ATP-binding protein [Peribacillus cavernae]MDQ0218657.1 type II secretory pathway predicted ATPase ExeA [Peribacillus cavernae]
MRGIHRIQPIVVVDEAHLLDREMLEEVRFLLKFKIHEQSPMALILVGQNELWDRLKRPPAIAGGRLSFVFKKLSKFTIAIRFNG